MCDKPVAATFWPFDEVADHWDSLILRSHIIENGSRTLYQEGALSGMLAPADLIARYTDGRQLEDGTLMFCGTFAAKGGIRPAPRFEYEIVDQTHDRAIRSGYDIATLPILG
jgi:2-keto-4-pentenoate hydratase/2-oxohepta-3-ene-1,7-dioic acid hydratase in catechol pathway